MWEEFQGDMKLLRHLQDVLFTLHNPEITNTLDIRYLKGAVPLFDIVSVIVACRHCTLNAGLIQWRRIYKLNPVPIFRHRVYPYAKVQMTSLEVLVYILSKMRGKYGLFFGKAYTDLKSANPHKSIDQATERIPSSDPNTIGELHDEYATLSMRKCIGLE